MEIKPIVSTAPLKFTGPLPKALAAEDPARAPSTSLDLLAFGENSGAMLERASLPTEAEIAQLSKLLEAEIGRLQRGESSDSAELERLVKELMPHAGMLESIGPLLSRARDAATAFKALRTGQESDLMAFIKLMERIMEMTRTYFLNKYNRMIDELAEKQSKVVERRIGADKDLQRVLELNALAVEGSNKIKHKSTAV